MHTGDNNTINRHQLRKEFRPISAWTPIAEDNYAIDAPEFVPSGGAKRFAAVWGDYEYGLHTASHRYPLTCN
jgi:hypothetical protein